MKTDTHGGAAVAPRNGRSVGASPAGDIAGGGDEGLPQYRNLFTGRTRTAVAAELAAMNVRAVERKFDEVGPWPEDHYKGSKEDLEDDILDRVFGEPSCASFGEFQFHPLVMAFPRLGAAQLEDLADDIRMRGEAAPILKHGEIILDDFNRCAACKIAGVPIKFREWDGSGSIAEVVAKAILPRTHFTESQRAAIAVPISDHLAGQTVPASFANLRRGKENAKTAFSAKFPDAAKVQHRETSENCSVANEPAEEKRLGRAAEIAAQLCQVSPRYVYEARKLRDVNRDLFNQVRLGLMNLSAARVAVSKIERAKNLPTINGNAIKRNQNGDGDELIVGDCLEKMAKMRDGIFDLVFADPPYNLGVKYDADPTHDLLPDARYQDWCERWMKQCARLLAPTGSIFVMIDARWQGRFDVILRNAGLHWRNTIVWHDTFPNNTDKKFQPAARFIHYFTRSAKNFTFNADDVRVPGGRDRIKDGRRVHDKGVVLHDVWGGADGGGGDVSRIQGNNPERVPFDDAPPQVPAAILERIILAASNAGDRVFDPFTGNGTTWRSARKHGRKFTGIERSAKYSGQARQWAMG